MTKNFIILKYTQENVKIHRESLNAKIFLFLHSQNNKNLKR